jgi:tetratricopeptide (TPR) repeat protein
MADKEFSPEIIKLMDKIAKNPTSRLFVPLAEEYLKSDMPDEAILVLVDGIKNHPTYVAARVMLGKIYLQKKQIAEAKKEFEQVIEVNPENILAGKKLTAIYQSEREIQKAFDLCKKILMIDPSDKETKVLLSSLEQELASLPKPESIPTPDPDVTKTDTILLSIDEKSQDLPAAVLSPNPEKEEPPLGESPSSITPMIPSEQERLILLSPPILEMKEPSDLLPLSLEEALELVPVEEIKLLDDYEGSGEVQTFEEASPDDSVITEEVKIDPALVVEAQPKIEFDESLKNASVEEPVTVDEPLAVESVPFQLAESSLEAESEEMATSSLASLYMTQGHFNEAVEVYRKILAQDPSDIESLKGLESALHKLAGVQSSTVSGSEKNRGPRSEGGTQRLESWLDSIRKDKGK